MKKLAIVAIALSLAACAHTQPSTCLGGGSGGTVEEKGNNANEVTPTT